MKTDKKFDAILAKNDIARQVRDSIQHREPMSTDQIMYCLNQIEIYLGQDNQPSVNDIINTSAYRL